MIYEFQGFKPVIKESAFVHETAVIIGNVIIGEKVYIGPGAVVRGDWGQIIIEDGCNIQENCVVHMFPGVSIRLEKGAHVGHGAIIHGANLGENVLIGMNAVVMDRSTIGAGSIVGALCFVKADTSIPERSLVVGNPAKVIKQVSDSMLAWKTKGTELYQELPGELFDSLKKCEPLREIEADRPSQKKLFDTWNETQELKK